MKGNLKKRITATLMAFVSRVFVYVSSSCMHSSFALTRTWSQPTTRSFMIYRLFRQTRRICEDSDTLHEMFYIDMYK